MKKKKKRIETNLPPRFIPEEHSCKVKRGSTEKEDENKTKTLPKRGEMM